MFDSFFSIHPLSHESAHPEEQHLLRFKDCYCVWELGSHHKTINVPHQFHLSKCTPTVSAGTSLRLLLRLHHHHYCSLMVNGSKEALIQKLYHRTNERRTLYNNQPHQGPPSVCLFPKSFSLSSCPITFYTVRTRRRGNEDVYTYIHTHTVVVFESLAHFRSGTLASFL